jgi:hypothetical protein
MTALELDHHLLAAETVAGKRTPDWSAKFATGPAKLSGVIQANHLFPLTT